MRQDWPICGQRALTVRAAQEQKHRADYGPLSVIRAPYLRGLQRVRGANQ